MHPMKAALLILMAGLMTGCASLGGGASAKEGVQVEYLEIVTPDVDATCDALAKLHGVEFSAPVPEFGNARTTTLSSGGRIGVRAPMAAHETATVRPYVLVDDLEAATAAADAAGGEIAVAGMELPGQCKISIYILGGIQHGLWQNLVETE